MLELVELAGDVGVIEGEDVDVAVPFRRSAFRTKAARVSFPFSLLLMTPTAPLPHAPVDASKNQNGVLALDATIGTDWIGVGTSVPFRLGWNPELKPLRLAAKTQGPANVDCVAV